MRIDGAYSPVKSNVQERRMTRVLGWLLSLRRGGTVSLAVQ